MNSQLRVTTPLDAVDSAMVALGYIFISLSVKDVAIAPKKIIPVDSLKLKLDLNDCYRC